MAEDAALKRVVAGLCGIGIGIAVLLLLQNVSGVGVQQWQEAIVFAAAAAGIVLWISKRRRRDDL